MALYDRSSTRSFYSEIAHEQDTCQYCENAIREKNNKKEINFDDMHRQLKALRGKLAGTRVMKFRYLGHEFCVCPTCLEKVNTEVQSFNKNESQSDCITKVEDTHEDVTNDETVSKSTKTRGKK